MDDKIYARTSSKKMKGMCFWGEYFGFLSLPKKAEKVTILIYKDMGRTRTKRKPVGRVKICVSSIQSRREVEKWYPVEKSSRRESPSIRLKAQYQSVDILPLRDYDLLTKYLNDEYNALCQILEPHISVKMKEELALLLMSVFNIQDVAEDVLAENVVYETHFAPHSLTYWHQIWTLKWTRSRCQTMRCSTPTGKTSEMLSPSSGRG